MNHTALHMEFTQSSAPKALSNISTWFLTLLDDNLMGSSRYETPDMYIRKIPKWLYVQTSVQGYYGEKNEMI